MSVNCNLIISPIAEPFEVPEICAWLDARPDVFQHPFEPEWYFICGYPSSASWCLDHVLETRDMRFSACTVHLSPTSISLDQESGGSDGRRSAMDYLSWMVDRFKCRVRVDGYEDLTEEIRRNGVPSLYPEDERTARLPWEGTLIALGFFSELPHSNAQAPSLALARQTEGLPEEAELVKYLESGVLYRRAVPLSETHAFMDPPPGDSTYDWFDSDIEIGPPHQLTDGVYIWPADLAYYLRTYHVRLPRSFVIHAKQNGWRVPPVDVATLPAFEV